MTGEPKRRATKLSSAAEEATKPGRPRVWSNAAEKHRAHRERRAEKAALVEDLLDAVRNAALEDPELQHTVNHGDDPAVLRALIAYYHARNWNLLRWQASKDRRTKQA